MTEQKPPRLQCQNMKLTTDNKRRRCTSIGVACWVIGEFGRQAKNLCGACITALRYRGWKVRYQLEAEAKLDVQDKL